MDRSNYWRDIYKHNWKQGSERVKIIQNLIKDNDSKIKIKNGFMSVSTQMLLDTPDNHKKGSPDFTVFKNNKPLFYGEVTGSNINIKENDLWIRPDKIKYALSNGSIPTYIYFVYNDKIFSMLITSKLFDFPIGTFNLKGVPEKYYVVKQSYACRLK